MSPVDNPRRHPYYSVVLHCSALWKKKKKKA